jgi:hypothetical protein
MRSLRQYTGRAGLCSFVLYVAASYNQKIYQSPIYL